MHVQAVAWFFMSACLISHRPVLKSGNLDVVQSAVAQEPNSLAVSEGYF